MHVKPTLKAVSDLLFLQVCQPGFLHHHWKSDEKISTAQNTFSLLGTQTLTPNSFSQRASSHISAGPACPCCTVWVPGCSTALLWPCSAGPPSPFVSRKIKLNAYMYTPVLPYCISSKTSFSDLTKPKNVPLCERYLDIIRICAPNRLHFVLTFDV